MRLSPFLFLVSYLKIFFQTLKFCILIAYVNHFLNNLSVKNMSLTLKYLVLAKMLHILKVTFLLPPSIKGLKI